MRESDERARNRMYGWGWMGVGGGGWGWVGMGGEQIGNVSHSSESVSMGGMEPKERGHLIPE